ncbi:T9SS type A sorting domain-containing protein [Siansivirga zeaxanthinifaciens]|uniref:Secretion system C-terminal sorting domain-containing protein n=1 Tax=Siansivirga zeaxanthinifaciens CC-SAMT-1 TaxID=1454006 RepID=A0A0C5WD36_9FLAO|nr:T9SS type A sorting domain-containing protein [Siansivirga zeaxanthinifaciens]AJR04988.1 hypothetical protein AW14_13660 [Siansivirga zeaxanthinifaciens CC-SAMT-1]
MNDAANTNTDGEARSYWVLAESTITTLSNNKFDASSVFVSSPVKNEIAIKGLTSNVKQVSVYTILGSRVFTKQIDGQSTLTIDASLLSSGMYIVELSGESGKFTKKIIKQ